MQVFVMIDDPMIRWNRLRLVIDPISQTRQRMHSWMKKVFKSLLFPLFLLFWSNAFGESDQNWQSDLQETLKNTVRQHPSITGEISTKSFELLGVTDKRSRCIFCQGRCHVWMPYHKIKFPLVIRVSKSQKVILSQTQLLVFGGFNCSLLHGPF